MSHAPPLPPSRPDQMSPASGGAPQPQESVVVPLKPDQQSDWHQVWNPLDLHETAAPAEDTKMLFVYFLWSFTSDKVLACAPLLILCGDPTQGSIVYWFLIGAIGVFAAVFTAFHLQTMHNSTPMTFFKATLYIEWLRESKVWRVLSLLMVGWFFAFVMFMNYLRSKKDPDAPEPKIAGINFIALPDDAPKFPAIPFFILLASFFKSVYDIITYDEIFDQHMLPSEEFVSKHYSSGYKAAQGKFANFAKLSQYFRYSVLAPFVFEPNIAVEHDGNLWMITDSATHLKNIMLACASVNAQVQRDTSILKTQKVKVFRDGRVDADSSLPWGCGPLHRSLAPCSA